MAYKTLGKKAREENSGWEYNLLGEKFALKTLLIILFCIGSGRNPRRQHKKEKAKELAYMRYGGYDSSDDFNSSPYVRYIISFKQ